MNKFISQSLSYMLDLANNNNPVALTTEGTDLDVAQVVNYASQLFDISSPQFEDVMNAVSLDKYCSINALRLVNSLTKATNKQDVIEIVDELVKENIPSLAFKKSIAHNCIDVIVRFKLLNNYKDYVAEGLKLINDTSINYVPVLVK